MIIEISDGTTPMLMAIKQVSRDVAYEHMSKVGDKVRKNSANRMTRHRHTWLQRSKNGKLSPYKSKTSTKELGMRTDKDGSVSSVKSMKHMITSNMMEESGTLIVGGRNRRKKVVLRKDGEIVGTASLPAITRHTQSIIHKLDTGRRNKSHGWGSGGLKKESMQGKSTTAGMGGRLFKGRGFMNDGFRDSIPYMKQEMKTGYEKTVGRAVNKVSVKLKPSERKIS